MAGSGATPGEALAELVASRGVGLVSLPKSETVFGFGRGRIADRLGDLAVVSGTPIRLQAPEGLGLAFLRITVWRCNLKPVLN